MTPREIMQLVKQETGQPIDQRISKRATAISRGIYFDLAYQFCYTSYKKIAEVVNYDFVTVLYWRNQLPKYLKTEPEYNHIYHKLKRNLKHNDHEQAHSMLMDEQAQEILNQMI